MAELVALTEWRITTHWPNPAMTSSVVLPWCRLPRPKYWRARTNSGRCYQVARQVAKLKSLAGLGWTDAEAKALRAAARVVVGEIDGFLAARHGRHDIGRTCLISRSWRHDWTALIWIAIATRFMVGSRARWRQSRSGSENIIGQSASRPDSLRKSHVKLVS
jgi:hypothetical protein